MRDDLQDALVPVKWAEAQIPILQDRILKWHHAYPYEIVVEPDPDFGNRELLVAYLKTPLDQLIIGDVGAMVNSIRTGLNLLMSAVVSRHSVVPDHAPDFPIYRSETKFLDRVKFFEDKEWVSATEAAAIKRIKAYSGGDNVLLHIAILDNLRKHRRLLTVEPIPDRATIAIFGAHVDRVMQHMDHKTILYRIGKGSFRPTKGNSHVAAEIFLNEAPAGAANKEALLSLRVYIARVNSLIIAFP